MESPVSILLIDDDEEDYILTRDLIEQINHRRYTVDWVDSYEKALEVIGRNGHDVCLVDYRLGARDGLELIREAQRMECRCPYILLTGQSDRETDEEALRAGASDYLIKGDLDVYMLERSIRYSIQQARTLKALRDLNAELEARVAARTEALRRSQQLYSLIAHNYPNGLIAILDNTFKFRFLDGREMTRLDIDTEVLLGRKQQEGFEAHSGLIATQYRKALAGEHVAFECTFSGNTYNFRVVPLPNENREIDQLLVVVDNITEQKKAALEVERALAKERQLNNLKSRFVSMASHEFRTPLSTVMSSASLASRYSAPAFEDRREKHLERIRSSVRHLSNILNDFLSLGKLEEGKVSLQFQATPLDEFVPEVIEEMQPTAKRGQTIQFRHTGEHVPVQTDRQLLRNILHNLISNAIKYSPEYVEIDVESAISETHFMLSVRDRGIGIPEEDQRHLFERFFRAHNATNIPGTGLGLNIVKEYVSLMDGNIQIVSKAGAGTTVEVSIPLSSGKTVPGA